MDPMHYRGFALAAALVLAACGPGDNTAEELPSGEVVGAREGPQRPPVSQVEGVWQLTAVSGAPLPAPASQDGACRVEVMEGTLRLEAERFAFQNRTREVCDDGSAGEPVMHAAGGTYALQGDAVVLTTDVGAAFAMASGRADETALVLSELSTQAGPETVDWRFERRDAQLVPVPGTTGTGN
jgi:hypothetical protein